MDLRLHPFSAESAGVVSGWATTNEEVVMWCGCFEPVEPHQAAVWNASQPVNYIWLSLR